MQMVCIACIIAESVKNVMFNNVMQFGNQQLYRHLSQSDIYLGQIFF